MLRCRMRPAWVLQKCSLVAVRLALPKGCRYGCFSGTCLHFDCPFSGRLKGRQSIQWFLSLMCSPLSGLEGHFAAMNRHPGISVGTLTSVVLSSVLRDFGYSACCTRWSFMGRFCCELGSGVRSPSLSGEGGRLWLSSPLFEWV